MYIYIYIYNKHHIFYGNVEIDKKKVNSLFGRASI